MMLFLFHFRHILYVLDHCFVGTETEKVCTGPYFKSKFLSIKGCSRISYCHEISCSLKHLCLVFCFQWIIAMRNEALYGDDGLSELVKWFCEFLQSSWQHPCLSNRCHCKKDPHMRLCQNCRTCNALDSALKKGYLNWNDLNTHTRHLKNRKTSGLHLSGTPGNNCDYEGELAFGHAHPVKYNIFKFRAETNGE